MKIFQTGKLEVSGTPTKSYAVTVVDCSTLPGSRTQDFPRSDVQRSGYTFEGRIFFLGPGDWMLRNPEPKWFSDFFFLNSVIFFHALPFFMLFLVHFLFSDSFILSYFYKTYIFDESAAARNVPKMPCRWHYNWEANPLGLMPVTTKSHVTVPGRRTMQRSSKF